MLGRTGRGLTEAQNVDPSQVDMIVGSLAGPLCAGGGFCAGTRDVVEHQRITSTAYTFSAALPAMLAMTASESLNVLQSNPEILQQCRENIRLMRSQLHPRSEWVICTSAPENPVMILVLKPEVIKARRLTIEDQERLLQECVDEVCTRPSLSFPLFTPSVLLPSSLAHHHSPPGTRKRRSHHPAQGPVHLAPYEHQGRRLDHAAGTQGVRLVGPVQEGDREGRCHDPPLHHQGHDAQEQQQARPADCVGGYRQGTITREGFLGYIHKVSTRWPDMRGVSVGCMTNSVGGRTGDY